MCPAAGLTTEKGKKGRSAMFFRIVFFSILVLELFGCSSMDQISRNSMTEQCYETKFMENDESCLDLEINELEQDLSESDRSIYEMAKRRISDKYQQLYFLRLTSREKRDYLSYIYDGEPPVYYKNSIF